MSNTYLDIKRISDMNVETMIVHEDEDEKFKDQRFLNIMLCFGFRVLISSVTN